jgi:UDP-glucose:(heptosyl)LPS alpha-1,3-glucosyltransferase
VSVATTGAARLHIVQCARTIGPGYGVSGPTWQLEQAFTSLGCTCERFTLENLGIKTTAMPGGSPLMALLRFWRDVVVFSTVGSVVLWWTFGRRRRRSGTVVICQVDALFGDLFVCRSLHKGFLERHPSRVWMLLRNPLHLFVLARDHVRFRWNVHRHIVALSEPNKNEIMRLYGVPADRITVIPNGVDLDRFQPSAEARRDVRRELSIGPEEFVAIFVGHEFERKGLRVVLEALTSLLARHVRLTLVVAGRDSPDRLKSEFSHLGDAVRFIGNRADVERCYAAADVFVMPAAFDISPLVGPEALASGLPILMTDVGGVRDYLRDGENGWFIEREAGDVAATLERLVNDRELLRQVSARTRASVMDRDWRVIAARFVEVITNRLRESFSDSQESIPGPSRKTTPGVDL